VIKMKSVILLTLLLLTGCSSSTLLLEDRGQIIEAIEQERNSGITNGPKILLRERGKKEIGSNGIRCERICYRFEDTGTTVGDHYKLYGKRLDPHLEYMGEYCVQENKGLVNLVDGEPLSDLNFFFYGYMKGEVISFAFVNNDSYAISVVTCVPNPIEARWDDGGYASVTALSPDMNKFCLKGVGFVPHETVYFTSKSCGQVHTGEYLVEEDGSFSSILEPNEKNMDGGICHIVLNRSIGEKAMRIPFGCFAKQERL
jgi:hypothetical protein